MAIYTQRNAKLPQPCVDVLDASGQPVPSSGVHQLRSVLVPVLQFYGVGSPPSFASRVCAILVTDPSILSSLRAVLYIVFSCVFCALAFCFGLVLWPCAIASCFSPVP